MPQTEAAARNRIWVPLQKIKSPQKLSCYYMTHQNRMMRHLASLRVQNSGQCKLVTRSIGGHMANDVKSSMFLPNSYVPLGHMTHLALCNVCKHSFVWCEMFARSTSSSTTQVSTCVANVFPVEPRLLSVPFLFRTSGKFFHSPAGSTSWTRTNCQSSPQLHSMMIVTKTRWGSSVENWSGPENNMSLCRRHSLHSRRWGHKHPQQSLTSR